MDKTIVVSVERLTRHRLYKRVIRLTTKFKAHDEANKAHIGDTLDVVVTQVIQTERGKMIFGEIEGVEEVRYERRRPTRPRTSA